MDVNKSKILLLIAMVSATKMAVSQSQEQKHDPYPGHWWQPVDRSTAPDWEVLPQDADRQKGEVILSKRNELGILSNFTETPFVFEHVRFKSLEGFWQMMKYPEDMEDPRAKDPRIKWQYSRNNVSQMVGFAAKAAGDLGSENMKTLNINWVTYKSKKLPYHVQEKGEHYHIIFAATEAKVYQNSKARAMLLKTGDLILRPDHQVGTNPPPAWRYYEILMEIRKTLLEEI